MTRATHFTEADVRRLIKGARAAGTDVRRIEITPDGRLVADLGEPADDATGPDPFLERLNAIEKGRSPRERQRVS